jgi:hypothetical protein
MNVAENTEVARCSDVHRYNIVVRYCLAVFVFRCGQRPSDATRTTIDEFLASSVSDDSGDVTIVVGGRRSLLTEIEHRHLTTYIKR